MTALHHAGDWRCPACGAGVSDELVLGPRPPMHEHDGHPVALVPKAAAVALSVEQQIVLTVLADRTRRGAGPAPAKEIVAGTAGLESGPSAWPERAGRALCDAGLAVGTE